LDCPAPTAYLNDVPIKDGKDFIHMRCTAATSDPKDFASDGYTLRQPMLGRKTELFIVLTMHNVSDIKLKKGLMLT
jgi:chitin synthase